MFVVNDFIERPSAPLEGGRFDILGWMPYRDYSDGVEVFWDSQQLLHLVDTEDSGECRG